MKSVFDTSTREGLINRINSLSQQHNAQWGKMDIYQMIRHCVLHDDMVLGKIKIKRLFLGRLLGKMVLNRVLKDDGPVAKNSPTSSY